LLAALTITFVVHAPTLRYFFAGDDFVVAGSIRYSGTGQYLLDSFRMRDIVPSWRPLTAVVYAAEWNAFGLNAMAWRSVNLALHLSSVGVMYVLVARVTKRPAAGAIAALIFGVSGAHFDTVTYITALPHVMATLFMLSSLLAIITAQDESATPAHSGWRSAFRFASLEKAFVHAPVIVGATRSRADGSARRCDWCCTPHRSSAAAGWLSFYESCSANSQVRWLLLGSHRSRTTPYASGHPARGIHLTLMRRAG
jgi:hypothetical protein